jgi:hypothetical protein
MAQPGWYPDPAGSPNRFRYWDGRSWSNETTDDPAGARPVGAASSGGRESSRRRLGPLILVVTALLVVVLAGFFVVRGLTANRPIVDPGPLPSSTVSGWDDSSPTTEPETPSPTPSASRPTPTPSQTRTPTPTPSPTEQLRACPEGQPTVRQDHPTDGRIHGGGLSFPEAKGWDSSSGAEFSWAYDVGEQMIMAESPNWYANLAVGALFTGDGFDEPRRSAELVMQCVITSGLYPKFTGREPVWSKKVTVDGRPGWSIRAEIRVDDPKLDTKGDTVEVIVVDTDSPESLSMFIGAVNIGDKALAATMDSTIEKLRVE